MLVTDLNTFVIGYTSRLDSSPNKCCKLIMAIPIEIEDTVSLTVTYRGTGGREKDLVRAESMQESRNMQGRG